ncbi:MAG: class I SAM-dependent methyltransferase [Candidatus Rokuibacteriota bacterium]
MLAVDSATLCYVCDGSRVRAYTDRFGYQHLGCGDCRFVRLDPKHLVPGATVYTAAYFNGSLHRRTQGKLGYPPSYADQSSSYRSRSYDRYASEVVRLVRQRTSSRPSVLDIGCAYGGFLKLLSSRLPEAEVHGVELDPEVCRIASANLGGARVYCTDLKDDATVPRGAFDAITLIDAIEHLEDPRSYLDVLRDCCRLDGYLLLSTPNIESFNARIYGDRWILHTPPYHTCYFGTKSLSLILAQTGWKLASFFTERTIFHNERSGMETWRGKAARALFDSRACDLLTNEILKIGSIITMIARKA